MLRPLAFPLAFAPALAAPPPFDEPPPNARPCARAVEALPILAAPILPAPPPDVLTEPCFEPEREKLFAPSPREEEPPAVH